MTEPAMTLVPVISAVVLVFLPLFLSRILFLFYSSICAFALGTIWMIYIYEASPQERHAGGSPGESFGPILFLFMPSTLFLAGIILRYVVASHLFSKPPTKNIHSDSGLSDDSNAIGNKSATTPRP